jgi:hypothetical protein
MLNLNYNIIGAGRTDVTRSIDLRAFYKWNYDGKTVFANGFSRTQIANATFNLNANGTNAVNIVTSSNDGFSSIESLPVTASMQGTGQWPVTGSTTMSLFIEAGGDAQHQPFYFLSAVSCSAAEGNIASKSGSLLEAKFTSSFSFGYSVTSSILHAKGNGYNPPINVLATGSAKSIYSQNSGSITTFNIFKDRNVLVSGGIGSITGSQSTSFAYEYAFNLTASLTGSSNWPHSSSFLYPTQSIIIPDLGIDVKSYVSQSIITASFSASKDTPYQITASVETRYVPAFTASLLVVGGGGGTVGGTTTKAVGGGGAGALYTGSIVIVPNRYYTINVGDGGKNINDTTASMGTASLFYGYDATNAGIGDDSILIITASGGEPGGMTIGNIGVGGNSGTVTAIKNGSTILNLGPFTASAVTTSGGGGGASFGQNGTPPKGVNGASGGDGGNGTITVFPGFPLEYFAGGGGGGGDDVSTQSAIGGLGGFGGGGAGSVGFGNPAAANSGGGAGGAGTYAPGQSATGGANGGSGVVKIAYLGTPVATGGIISYDGNATTHTFISGSNTFIYALEPQQYP